MSKIEINPVRLEYLLDAVVIKLQYRDRTIRVVVEEGRPWWSIDDILSAAGIREVGMDVMTEILPDWQKVHYMPSTSIEREIATLCDPGLYFLLGRIQPFKERDLQQWLTSDAFRMLEPFVERSNHEHAFRAYTMALALGECVMRETYERICDDTHRGKERASFHDARYLVALSHKGAPVVHKIEDDMRFVSSKLLGQAFDDHMISSENLARYVELFRGELTRRDEWLANHERNKTHRDAVTARRAKS